MVCAVCFVAEGMRTNIKFSIKTDTYEHLNEPSKVRTLAYRIVFDPERSFYRLNRIDRYAESCWHRELHYMSVVSGAVINCNIVRRACTWPVRPSRLTVHPFGDGSISLHHFAKLKMFRVYWPTV